jgi:glycosyltransferase involved in cell wall biosynthesis
MLEKISPRLTLAYVTYNRKKLISNRVNNLLNMKIPSYIEIIIIDDCSSDGTYEALKKNY